MRWRTVLTWGPRIALVVVLVAANVSLVAAMSSSAMPYSVYNDEWDGATDLRDQLADAGIDTSIVIDTRAYETVPANGTVAFVLDPISAYDRADIARLNRFLANGGTLIVAAENGTQANSLLESVGADARIDRRVVRDGQSNYRSSALPLAVPAPIGNGSTTDAIAELLRSVDDIETVTLNYGATVDPGEATPLLYTRSTAYVDANDNGTLDDGESLGRRPVGTVESVGSGTVIVAGDPSIFTNAMLEREGNRAFLAALVEDHRRAIVDYSHGRSIPPLPFALITLRGSPLLQLVVGVIAFGGLALWYWGPTLSIPRPWHTDRESASVVLSEGDLRSFLRDRHPDWDDEEITRVTKAIIRRRRKAGSND
ncbi:MAG: DUF4350 domain-containing protein [Halorhabdus sp.]